MKGRVNVDSTSRIARIFIPGFLAAIFASECIAVLLAGTADQSAFLIWTIPFAFGIASLLALSQRLFRDWNPLFRVPMQLVFGVSGGIIWTICTATILGPWVGAFSMPIGLCWTAGGITSAVTVVLISNLPVAGAIPALIISAVSLISLALQIPPLIEFLTNHRTVSITFIEYVPGKHPLAIDRPLGGDFYLSSSEIAAIETHHPTGLLRFCGGSITGRGQPIRLVIVMHKPLSGEQRFPLPEQGTLTLIQSAIGWNQIPKDCPGLNQYFTLQDVQRERHGRHCIITAYEIEHPDGSRTGGEVFEWDESNQNE